MPQSDIDLTFLCDLLRQAGALALGQRGQMVAELKPDRSPVTAVDRQVETFLLERIQARYPRHRVLSEESGAHAAALAGDGEFAWAIDPIDGTRSFAGGLPVWGISAGVLRAGQPYAGAFFLPVTGELYWGTRDEAWYGERRLPRLDAVDAHSPLTFLAVPSNFHRHFDVSLPRVRSMGSTAAHLAYVACGSASAMVVRSASLWDLAGVLPLALAVGVTLEYFSGRPFDPADLLDGGGLREALVAAHPSAMPAVRAGVHLR